MQPRHARAKGVEQTEPGGKLDLPVMAGGVKCAVGVVEHLPAPVLWGKGIHLALLPLVHSQDEPDAKLLEALPLGPDRQSLFTAQD